MYFDYAATSLPKPERVIDAVARAMRVCGNSSRGGHEQSVEALRCLSKAREALAGYLGVGDGRRVVFCHNATAALNIAIGSVRGHIVTTAAEHNSVLRPLHRRGDYTVVPVDSAGRLDPEQLACAIRPDTGAVVMTHASNVTGRVYDIATVGAICRKRGVRFIVDAAQSAGLVPIHMERLKISALCLSGHKSLFGPQGIGVLCLGEDFAPVPLQVGGTGVASLSPEQPGELPELLEAGTQNAHGIAGLLEGLCYVQAGGREFVRTADALAREFVRGARELPRVTLYGDLDEEQRIPVVALNMAGVDGGELAFLLQDRYGISVRAGLHCAPLMHSALGTLQTGAVRFSFSHLNTAEEVGEAVRALRELETGLPGATAKK